MSGAAVIWDVILDYLHTLPQQSGNYIVPLLVFLKFSPVCCP